ncbi:uncharacterized [Tachysurus ichikawai]
MFPATRRQKSHCLFHQSASLIRVEAVCANKAELKAVHRVLSELQMRCAASPARCRGSQLPNHAVLTGDSSSLPLPNPARPPFIRH